MRGIYEIEGHLAGQIAVDPILSDEDIGLVLAYADDAQREHLVILDSGTLTEAGLEGMSRGTPVALRPLTAERYRELCAALGVEIDPAIDVEASIRGAYREE